MPRVTFLGYLPTDLKGPERLDKLLNSIRPNYIICPGSPESAVQMNASLLATIVHNKSNITDVIEEAGYRLLHSFMDTLGYEDYIPFQYAKATGIPVHNLDLSRCMDFDAQIDRYSGSIDSLVTKGKERFQEHIDSKYGDYMYKPKDIRKAEERNEKIADAVKVIQARQDHGAVILDKRRLDGNYGTVLSFMNGIPFLINSLTAADYLV